MMTTTSTYQPAPLGPRLNVTEPLEQTFQMQQRAPKNPMLSFQSHSGAGKLEDQDHYRKTTKYWDPLDITKLDKKEVVYFEKNPDPAAMKKINTGTWVYREENTDIQAEESKRGGANGLSSTRRGWDGPVNSPGLYGESKGEDSWKKSFYGSRQLGLGCPQCGNFIHQDYNNQQSNINQGPSLDTYGIGLNNQQGFNQNSIDLSNPRCCRHCPCKTNTLSQAGANAIKSSDEEEAEIEGRWAARAVGVVEHNIEEARNKMATNYQNGQKLMNTHSGWAQWSNLPAPNRQSSFGPDKKFSTKDRNNYLSSKDYETKQEWTQKGYTMNPSQAESKVLLTQGVRPNNNITESGYNQSWCQPAASENKDPFEKRQQAQQPPLDLKGEFKNSTFKPDEFKNFQELNHAKYTPPNGVLREGQDKLLYGRVSNNADGKLLQSNETNIDNPMFPSDRIAMYDNYKTVNAEAAKKEGLTYQRE